jgi:hypothetical protein
VNGGILHRPSPGLNFAGPTSRRWSMKEPRPPKSRPAARTRRNWHIETRKIGAGITERNEDRVVIAGPLSDKDKHEIEDYFGDPPRDRFENEFEWGISNCEASAKRVLEQAGLPCDSSVNYTTDGKPLQPHFPGCDLLRFVYRRGFRPHEHFEWYAAKALMLIYEIRCRIRQGEVAEAAYCAVCLGELVKEADMKFAFDQAVQNHRRCQAGGAIGGGHSKRLDGVLRYVASSLSKNRTKTAGQLWNDLIRYEGEDPLVVGKTGEFEIYRDGEKLVQVDNKSERSIKFEAFKKYVQFLKSQGK